jgi:zinc protease
MLAEAVIHPRHGKGSFSGRRNAALDAFEDLESSDPEAFQQVVADGAFGEGHPYARSIAGTTASLTPLGLEDVIAHQERVLVPDGATLVIVGDVDSTLVLAAARKAFEKWAGQRAALPRVPPPALPADTRTVGYLERRSASTLVVCATRPLADVHASDAALDVLAAMLGEGTASRLGTVLRESNGLTYGASAQIVHRRHARALVACSALKGKEAPLGVELFRKVLERAQTAEPTPAELERAKAVRLSELETAYETALDASHTWVEAVAIGTGAPRLEQERAAIEKVTAAEVQKLARSVLSLKTVRWVVSGDKLVASRAIEATGVGRLHKISPGR